MVNSKIDGALAARVHSLTAAGAATAGAAAAEQARIRRVRVLVHVVGDIRAVQRAGLWTELYTGEVAIGTIAVGDLDRVAALDDVASIESDRLGHQELHDSAAEIRADHARAVPPGFDGTGVVVGVVDSGIDIFHHSFRKPDGTTRIVSLLDITQRHTIEITGSPTGGSFTLSWRPPALPGGGGGAAPPAETTASLNLPVSAQQLQTALEAFNSINPGDVTVTGGPLPTTPVVVDFTGRYDGRTFDTSKLNGFGFGGTLSGGTSPGMTIVRGREFRAAEINAALQTPDKPFLSRDTDGHGTHVAGIAAGDGSQAGNCHGSDYYIGIAPKADLAVVRWTTRMSDIVQGVTHLFDQPWRPTGQDRKPVVVNVSLGSTLGPHDGTDNTEIALDSMLTGTQKRAVVVSAGNCGRIVDPQHPELDSPPGGGLHAFKKAPKNATTTIELVILAEDRAMDVFEIWYAGAGRLNFNLRTPPGVGAAAGAVLPAEIVPGGNPAATQTQLAGHPLSIWSTTGNQPSGKHRIEVKISPAAAGRIAPGTWTVILRETQGTDTDFDCWVAVDKTDPHPFIRQDQQVRTRTITTPGNAANVITVGAYDTSTGALTEFSSRGPATNGALRTEPDLCAPGGGITSAQSGARGSSIWCDCCCDFYLPYQGTSQAAPHVTGVVALMLQANPSLDYVRIADLLRTTCRPPDPPVTLPSNEWGQGKVHAENAVLAAKAAAVPSGPTTSVSQSPGEAADERVVLSAAAYADTYLPMHIRLRELQRRLAGSPLGQLAAALVSEHVDEVGRLIVTERRVLVAWHRMNGPALLRLLFSDVGREVPLPARLGGRPVADGLAELLDELARAGGPALRADIEQHRALLLALPGSSLADLDRRVS